MESFIPFEFWILFAAAMVISSIGFYKYVYFISLGYGFSISGLGIAMLVMFRSNLHVGTILACGIFFIYGIRLSGYLLLRELKSSTYRNKMKTEIKDGKNIGFGVKCAIWITCAVLYVTQVLPVFYRMHNGGGFDLFNIVGVCIMVVGILFESVADLQKNASKKKNPNRFCDTGLYKIVRCPNYLGEMLFWTGVLISGLNVLSGVGQWVLVLMGYFGIIFVMFSGARRLELRQNRTYGEDPEYRNYVKTVPILLPFIPLYSVAKYKFLVA
jgi:steroid 5-alpha reductase family enzyme